MAAEIPFIREIDFEYGVCQQMTPLIRRVIANNPGPFTYTGTGTYIVGRGEVAVIDPGPLQDEHVDAILGALDEGETVSHILITHTHSDHSPAAAPLKARTGATTYGYGETSSEAPGDARFEEGSDTRFHPDVAVAHGDVIEGPGWTFECVHTPGHMSNHMCFALREENALFTGDHVMGWSTSVIVPPDGNMRDYMASLRLLLDRDDAIYWPTHGSPIREPKPFVEAFIAHREDRERQILDQIAAGRTRIGEMVPVMYANVDKRLHPAAAMSVFAHVIHMVETGRLRCEGAPSADAAYSLA